MALSGTISSSKTSGYWTRVTWTATQDIAANTSRVSIKVYACSDNYEYTISSRSDHYSTVTVNGSSSKSTFSTPGHTGVKGSQWLVQERSFTVSHKDDGTAAVSVKAYFHWYLSSCSSTTASGTINLDTIPRASTVAYVTDNVVVDRDVFRISMDRKSELYSHVLQYRFMGGEAVEVRFDEGAEINMDHLAPLIEGGTWDSGTWSVQTYNTQTEEPVGDAVSGTFTVSIDPELGRPQFTVTHGTTNAGTGISMTDIILQGFTRPTVSLSGFAGYRGATLATIRANGVDVPAGGGILVLDPFSGYGRQTVTVVCTDSRGLSVTEVIEYEVNQYTSPTITDVTVYRCDQDGVRDDDEGTYIHVMATAGYALDAIGGSMTVSMAGGVPVALTSGAMTILPGAEATRSYPITISAADIVGGTAGYSTIVGSVLVTFNALDGGDGFAFGKYATRRDTLDTNWTIRTGTDDGAGHVELTPVGNVDATGNVAAGGAVSGASGSFTGNVSAGSAKIGGALSAVSMTTTAPPDGSNDNAVPTTSWVRGHMPEGFEFRPAIVHTAASSGSVNVASQGSVKLNAATFTVEKSGFIFVDINVHWGRSSTQTSNMQYIYRTITLSRISGGTSSTAAQWYDSTGMSVKYQNYCWFGYVEAGDTFELTAGQRLGNTGTDVALSSWTIKAYLI